MEERYLLGTSLFIEVGSNGRLFTLNGVGNKEKANLVTIVPAGRVPFQGGELAPVENGTVGKHAIEEYIHSYQAKVSPEAAPKPLIQQAYLLEIGIYTTEKPR
jgi:hypothetical protein